MLLAIRKNKILGKISAISTFFSTFTLWNKNIQNEYSNRMLPNLWREWGSSY
ncbi:hypothetical protein CCAND95_50121 [Capnocytophaga canis]|uniref:Uncharacterized protein n=1 Tax=Capnocytophaga canis TaxID=1848903 RepID=A0A0B7IBA6_9FLAO|nr:hypothetical protein CCAND95_50121 [Capnocytophaga canis]CEN49191.1 hypothetical protein CCAND38_80010 [Capnocytophaga canis]